MVKDSAYHKEKMLLCNKEAHYSYMAKIQEVPIADSATNLEPVEQNEQNDVESDDERVVLANLIANLKLDVNENKKIQKQLKKANITLAQELKECKAILAETSKSLGESISVRDSCLVVLQTKQAEFEKYKAFNDRTVEYDKLEKSDVEVVCGGGGRDILKDQGRRCGHFKVQKMDCGACKQLVGEGGKSLRETVGSSMVQKSRIQCYNCKEYGHVARECQKPKRAKDAAYHREKMLLCKQEEARIQLNAKQANWKDDTDDESDDQELEAHYMYMAKLQ
nr:hypothetical protein [Tanacetum cinerariifolium]